MTVLVLFGIYIRKHLFSVCLSVQWAFLFFWLNWGSAHALISATKWFEIEIPGHDRLSGITKIVINLNWHLHHTHTRSQRRFRSIFTIVNESTKSTVKTSNGNCCFVCAKCNSPVRASRTRPTFTSAPKNRKTTNKNNDEMCAFCVFVEPLLSLMSWINFGELCFVYAPRARASYVTPISAYFTRTEERNRKKTKYTQYFCIRYCSCMRLCRLTEFIVRPWIGPFQRLLYSVAPFCPFPLCFHMNIAAYTHCHGISTARTTIVDAKHTPRSKTAKKTLSEYITSSFRRFVIFFFSVLQRIIFWFASDKNQYLLMEPKQQIYMF